MLMWCKCRCVDRPAVARCVTFLDQGRVYFYPTLPSLSRRRHSLLQDRRSTFIRPTSDIKLMASRGLHLSVRFLEKNLDYIPIESARRARCWREIFCIICGGFSVNSSVNEMESIEKTYREMSILKAKYDHLFIVCTNLLKSW